MCSPSAKVRVRAVADRQAGRVGAAQLAALGVETFVVARWVASGYLHQVIAGKGGPAARTSETR